MKIRILLDLDSSTHCFLQCVVRHRTVDWTWDSNNAVCQFSIFRVITSLWILQELPSSSRAQSQLPSSCRPGRWPRVSRTLWWTFLLYPLRFVVKEVNPYYVFVINLNCLTGHLEFNRACFLCLGDYCCFAGEAKENQVQVLGGSRLVPVLVIVIGTYFLKVSLRSRIILMRFSTGSKKEISPAPKYY
jgi:hypothetical protein